MAGKRTAGYDLNADNWDKEEEPEDRGVFKTASEDELKNRVIKKARRKMVGSSGDGEAPKLGAFASFSGFGKTTSTSTTLSAVSSSPFSFLSKISTATSVASLPSVTTSVASSSSKDNVDSTAKNGKEKSNEEYLAKLKGLNLAVLDWIKSHLDKNPLVILSPIFKDYEKHLADIQKSSKIDNKDKVQILSDVKISSSESKPTSTFSFGTSSAKPTEKDNSEKTTELPKQSFSFGANSSESAKPSSGFTFGSKTSGDGKKSESDKPEDSKPSFSFGSQATKESPKSTFSFGAKPAESSEKTGFTFGSKSTEDSSKFSFGSKPTGETTKGFSFGSSTDNNDEKPKPAFSFGATAAAPTTGFSFSGAKPFSFGSVAPAAAPSSTDTQKEDEEESEEPPKNEFTQVEEKDSVYSKKCKVYVKNEEKFGDRGVGTLHLKPVEGQEKTQLIVRADTNLGNLLLNLLLNESVPTKRMGKKDVLLVGVPMPTDKKPTQILIRVKTEEEADQLLEVLEKHKK